MSFAYGIQAIHPSSAPHILGFASARTGATDLLLDIWNGSTSAARVFAVQKDGRVEMSDGTAAAPMLTFISDLDSGLYRIGADNLGVAVGGSKVVDIGAATIVLTGDVTISGTLTGVTDVTASGNVSGTWNGTAIGAAKGGTGQTSYATGDILYASGASALSKLGIGAPNTVLISSGSAIPAWTNSPTLAGLTSVGAVSITGGGLTVVAGVTVSSGGVDVTGLADFKSTMRVLNDGTSSAGVGAGTIIAGKDTGDVGLTLYGGTADEGRVAFKTDTSEMAVIADHGAGTLSLSTDAGTGPSVEQLRWNGQALFLRETANAKMTYGLTMNQQATTDEILALKSTAVAHALTAYTETDTFASLRRMASTTGKGGLEVFAVNGGNAGDVGFRVQAAGHDGAGTKNVTADGIVEFIVARNLAGSANAAAAGDNLFVVKDFTNARFLIDAEGDVHYDGATNAAAWDEHDDVGLLSTLRAATMGDGQAAKRWFGQWVDHPENRRVLEESGVVTFNEDGHHFVSTKGLNALMIDAIRQTNERWQGAVRDLIERNGLDTGPELTALLEAGR